MFDLNIVQSRRFRYDQRKISEALVDLSLDSFDQDVVNAVAPALGTESSRIGRNVSDREPAADVDDLDRTNRHIRHHATRALVSLACRHENNREAGLRETAPGIFQQIVFEQNPLSVLE